VYEADTMDFIDVVWMLHLADWLEVKVIRIGLLATLVFIDCRKINSTLCIEVSAVADALVDQKN